MIESGEASAAVMGLSIVRSGRAIEAVESKAVQLRLLATGTAELIHGRLSQGERITLVPAGGEATEIYYLLAGRILPIGSEGEDPLGPGDVLVARKLASEVIFTALEEVSFLYFTSQPFFAQISHNIGELMRLAVEVEQRDGYTGEHCERLQRLCFATGREVGLDSHRLWVLDRGAYLHDLGKVKVPLAILTKPGPLTDDEWAIVRRHPSFGRELLEETSLREAGPILEQHHERLDGSGYPHGLRGDAILPESLIVAIADTFDAMTSDRCYRKALPVERAVEELQRFADVHFPRELVAAFLRVGEREGLL